MVLLFEFVPLPVRRRCIGNEPTCNSAIESDSLSAVRCCPPPMLSLSSSSSEEESRRRIAIGDDVGIDMGVEDVDGGILQRVWWNL